jgi:alpha-L-fucosidase
MGTSGAFSDNEESLYTVQDIRFTTKGDKLYAISLAWTDSDVVIRSIGDDKKVAGIRMLGSDETISWDQSSEGLRVTFPEKMPTDFAHALEITFN